MVSRIVSRFVISFFWIGIIFGFLFLPSIGNRLQKDSLNVFVWSGIIDPQIFKAFEQKTGIPVNVTYFGGNEELIVKLLATKSKGYDLIMPSDYAVKFLIDNKLLKKLDKRKLTFYDQLNHKFMGHYFDPQNDYSIPAEWYVLGLGVNKKFFKNGLPLASWKTVFDPKIMPQNIGLINDSRELIALASFYLYGKVAPLNQQQVQEVTTLLLEQKKQVEAYTDFRGDFLLDSGNCPVVMGATSYMWKTVRDNPELVYLIPQEGTFLNLENYVIPAACQKEKQVYQLLNFLFEPENEKHNFEEFYSVSTRKDADYLFNEPALKNVVPLIHPETSEQPIMFQNFLTDEQVNQIWLTVKSS
jgi:spermidine/putrescine transport system substrate-binding protein